VTFRRRAAPAPVPASPEALYPVLAHGGRPGAPKELWSRQADVLREYHRLGPEKTDVAIELPTGAGKTLVGCLIAEWRRRKNGERVAYVAPTRQLAGQADAQARLYGVPAVDLTGSWRAWAPGEQVRFTQGEAVAFVTYSTVFNRKPHISPQVLVLDDAHAAEGFVASNWSVSTRRGEQAYAAVLDVLAAAGALSADVVHRLRRDDPEGAGGRGAVYLAGVAEVAAAAGELEKILEDAASAGELSTSAAFSLEMITGSMPACTLGEGGEKFHFSLHASGQWHMKEGAQERISWARPGEVVPGYTRAVGIVQPVATAVREDPPVEKTVLVYVPTDANPTTFSLFIERPGANLDNSWPGKNADGTTLVGRVPLAAGAGTCCVVALQQPLQPGRADFPRPSDDELRRMRDVAARGPLIITIIGELGDGAIALFDLRADEASVLAALDHALE
jgi:hypothetical protein